MSAQTRWTDEETAWLFACIDEKPRHVKRFFPKHSIGALRQKMSRMKHGRSDRKGYLGHVPRETNLEANP